VQNRFVRAAALTLALIGCWKRSSEWNCCPDCRTSCAVRDFEFTPKSFHTLPHAAQTDSH